jgi:hypothetical protein
MPDPAPWRRGRRGGRILPWMGKNRGAAARLALAMAAFLLPACPEPEPRLPQEVVPAATAFGNEIEGWNVFPFIVVTEELPFTSRQRREWDLAMSGVRAAASSITGLMIRAGGGQGGGAIGPPARIEAQEAVWEGAGGRFVLGLGLAPYPWRLELPGGARFASGATDGRLTIEAEGIRQAYPALAPGSTVSFTHGVARSMPYAELRIVEAGDDRRFREGMKGEGAGTYREVETTFLHDVVGGPARERVALVSRVASGGQGRTDVTITGGDLDAEVTAVECWRWSGGAQEEVVHTADSAGLWSQAGSEEDCAVFP